MKLRYLSLISIAASASLAANEPEVGAAVPTWSVEQRAAACGGKLLISNYPAITILSSRSYLQTKRRPIKFGFSHPIAASLAHRVSFELRIDGEDSVIGTGYALGARPEQGPNTYFNATLNENGEERFEQGVKAGSVLVFTAGDTEINRVKLNAFNASPTKIDECFADLGEKLLAARPSGESEDAPPRGPIPKNNMGRWVTVNDYRASWINRDYAGVVRFRLSVSKYGFVADCTITESSGYAPLDTGTCRLLKRRARFYPARDADQSAMTGTYSSAVRWQIPE